MFGSSTTIRGEARLCGLGEAMDSAGLSPCVPRADRGAADDPQILDPPFSIVMSCFAQTLCAFGRILSTGAVREYAEEAMQWSSQTRTEEEKKVLIDLAFTWTQAASLSEKKSVAPLRA
jgi:hypothetical protein